MKNIIKSIAVGTFLLIIPYILFPNKGFAITTKEEEDLSREFLVMTFENYQIIEDPIIADYINNIGRKILAVMPSRQFPFRFYVIREESYNAFAGPAGHIFINSGLLEAMESEDEIAGILSHEISHVNCRHISSMIERSKKTGIATLAGIATGILLGIGGASEIGSAVTIGSVAAGQTVSLAYSRENEMQADQVSLKYLNKAGYSAEGLLKILKKIRNKTWYGSDQIPTYLVTHPATEDRINYIGAWIQSNESPEKKADDKINLEFNLMRSRITALYGERSIALEKLKNEAALNPEDPFAQYGYGLILSRMGDRKGAITYLKKALEKKPFYQIFIRDLGKMYYLDGKYHKALELLKSSKSLPQFDAEGELYLARTLKKLSRNKEAVSAFQKILEKRPAYSKTYYYLGEIYGKMGQLGDAHYYLGTYYRYERKYDNAVFHLKKALEFLTDSEKIDNAKKMLEKLTGDKETYSGKKE
ncbi:MAG: M48 family metalloprotease [Desulfobacterales bacterium]